MTMPNVGSVLTGFAQTIEFAVVHKTVQDFESIETDANIVTFLGTLQPIPGRKLLIKPEGQRSWRWWYLHTKQALDIDWVVQDTSNQGHKYRVMSKANWNAQGFYKYEITEAPADE